MQDPEGAKTAVISFNTSAGAVASVIKRMFLITCYTEADTGRLRLDPTLTARQNAGSHTGAKKILIYDTYPHPLSSLDPSICGPGTTPRDHNTWVINNLKVMDHFTTIPLPNVAERNTNDMDNREGQPTPPQPVNAANTNKG